MRRTTFVAAFVTMTAVLPARVLAQGGGAETGVLADLVVYLLFSGVGAVYTLAVGGIVVALSPEFARETRDRVRDAPLLMTGYGLGYHVLFRIAFAIVALVLIFTLIGILVLIPISLVAQMFDLFVLLLATPVAAIGVGSAIAERAGYDGLGAALVAGTLPLLIPVVNLGVGIAYFLLGSGVLVEKVYAEFREGRESGMENEPTTRETRSGDPDRTTVEEQGHGVDDRNRATAGEQGGADEWGHGSEWSASNPGGRERNRRDDARQGGDDGPGW